MYKIVVEIPEGWGVILVIKKWKFRGGGEAYVKVPSVVGVWIFSGTTHCHLLIPISIYIITMNAHTLIGQAAMVYCAGNYELIYKRNTPQVSMVYRLIRIRKSLRLMIYEFFECSTNILRGLSAYKA